MNKQFEDFLQEAGIKIPTIGRFFFEWKWKGVEEEYFQYCSAFEEKKSLLEKYKQEIFNLFGNDAEVNDNFTSVEGQFSFKTFKQAQKQIRERIKNIERFNPYEWFQNEKKKLQEAWFYEIVGKAQKEGAWLVIKSRGYKPYQKNESLFNDYVENKKFATIRMLFTVIVWAVFDPTNSKEVEEVIERLGVYPNDAEITLLN